LRTVLRRRRAEVPRALEPVVDRVSAPWRLDESERTRLMELVEAFVRDTRWEAARGFQVTDEMKIVVATRACRLLLGLDTGDFRDVTTVILHPATVVLRGQWALGAGGVVASGPYHVEGQAHHRGPVVLSWAAVRSSTLFPQRGQDVVAHEFAHQLDMLDGTVDGTPPLDDSAARARWIDICTRVYDDLRAGRGSTVLRPYAATNPGEFFAVATEVFFCRPVELRDAEPDLYRELVAYFGQDPASRFDGVTARLGSA
jgi:Mlc titration factor MtfA (ptsG expression regulator)